MKIVVKNTWGVIATGLVYAAPRMAIYFAAAFLGASIILPLVFQVSLEQISLLVSLISLTVLVVVVAQQIVDSLLHTKNTTVELTDSGIDCEMSGFTTESFSIPLNQISNVRVSQAFLDKFFGIASIVVSQVAGTFSVYGFEYEEAKEFAKEYSKQQQSN